MNSKSFWRLSTRVAWGVFLLAATPSTAAEPTPPGSGGADRGNAANQGEKATAPDVVGARPEGDAAAPKPLEPPKLLEYVTAIYPEAAYAQGLEANVLAEIDIDAAGNVVDVRVIEPAGNGFDEAAVAAMKRFRFAPALKDGVPIPARVTYQYRFFLSQAEPVEGNGGETGEAVPDAPLPAAISGTVLTMEDAPVDGAYVRISPTTTPEGGDASDAAGPGGEGTTDAAGRFVFDNLTAGDYRIEIIAPGYLPFEIDERVEAGEARELIYRLELEGAAYEVVVRGKRPMREVTRRVVTAKEIAKIPGTGGDALRAVQNMPGMARVAFNGGALIVRGASPGDTVYFFDGVGTPLLYHFGGMTSVINSDLLDAIDFYPGNFSVKYGRAMGGVVDVTTRSPKTDRLHGYIDADIWDAGVLLEGPIGDKWSLAVTARRSYIDAAVQAVHLFGDRIKVTVAPRYYDFQVIADYHPHKRDHLKILAYGTDDRWIMDWDDDGDLAGSGLSLKIYTYQAQAEWTHRFNDTVANELRFSFGYWGMDNVQGIMEEHYDVFPLLLRDELSIRIGEAITLRLGTDSELRIGKAKVKVPDQYPVEGGLRYPWSANDQLITFKQKDYIGQPGLYAELALDALPRTQLIFGIRGDYHSVVNRFSADPRVTVRYDLFPETTLKAGFGMFHQPGDIGENNEHYGNPDLKIQEAVHYSVGFEQGFAHDFELSMEGFYKDLRRLVTSSADVVERNGEMVPERFDNDATGRVYGLETELKHQPTDRFFGWITYTLMRSERTEDGVTRLFDYDQTHILTVVGSVHIGWGVDVGLRFRLVSGSPYTPIEGGSYDADSDLYNPIYGANNGKRRPLFHQLDLRVDKKWQWKYLAFTAYLDIQNVYNYKNTEFYAYSFDYNTREKVQGLPIIPSIGLKLEY